MKISPRGIIIGLLSFLMLGALAVVLMDISMGQITLRTGVNILALAMFSVLLWLTWRRWAYASYALIIVVVVLTGGGMDEPYLTTQFSAALLLPTIIALVLANPPWIIGSAVSVLALVLVRAGGQGVYADLPTLIIYALDVSGLVLARLVTINALQLASRAQTAAETSAAALQTANVQLEQRVTERTIEVQAALSKVEAQADEQARLLAENTQQREAILHISVPVLPISSHVLVMPLVGELDSHRLRLVQQQALQHIEGTTARHLILDITGVTVVDSQVAQGLIAVVQATRLLGADAILVGIRPEVAQTIVGLGVQLEVITTRSTLQEGIAYALRAGAYAS